MLQIAVSFVHLALLGAALGLGFGLVTSFWLANIWNDPGARTDMRLLLCCSISSETPAVLLHCTPSSLCSCL